jgi:hypothetical protein
MAVKGAAAPERRPRRCSPVREHQPPHTQLQGRCQTHGSDPSTQVGAEQRHMGRGCRPTCSDPLRRGGRRRRRLRTLTPAPAAAATTAPPTWGSLGSHMLLARPRPQRHSCCYPATPSKRCATLKLQRPAPAGTMPPLPLPRGQRPPPAQQATSGAGWRWEPAGTAHPVPAAGTTRLAVGRCQDWWGIVGLGGGASGRRRRQPVPHRPDRQEAAPAAESLSTLRSDLLKNGV